jgi:hypothetical protein
MGCNCGKNKTANVRFKYVAPDKKVTYYSSEVEARAAKIRNKGGTYTRVV